MVPANLVARQILVAAHMLTLRQIEVIRAIVVTGSVGGAARLLNVSSPGISRVMKHAEGLLGLKLFSRTGRRYTPTREANDLFSQINGVYDKVEDLHSSWSRSEAGRRLGAEDRLGAEHLQRHGAARHCRRTRATFPEPADRR